MTIPSSFSVSHRLISNILGFPSYKVPVSLGPFNVTVKRHVYDIVVVAVAVAVVVAFEVTATFAK